MAAVLDRVREPAYTGADRCWPCTVVNVALLAVGVVAVALVSTWWAGAIGGVVGLTVIWLRGYLVPYTPRFAPRLVAPLPWDPFHAGDDRRAGERKSLLFDPDDADIDGERLLEHLLEVGVLEPGEDGQQLVLAPDVREAWSAELAHYRELSIDALAEAADERARNGTVEPVSVDDEWLDVYTGGEYPDHVIEVPVAIADLATASALDDRIDDPELLSHAVKRFRLFLEACPRCGTDLVETDTLDCCGGMVDPQGTPDEILACPSCDVTLYTFETTDSSDAAT